MVCTPTFWYPSPWPCSLLRAVTGLSESAPVPSTPWPSCWWWVKCSTTAWAFGIVNLFTRGTLPTALFMVVMYVGALDHRRPLVRKLLAIRGPLSIMACILTLGHNLMYGIRHFVMLFVAPETMRPTTLVAAILSLLMIVLMIPLMVTSFSRVRRRMSAASWKRLQRLAYLFFGLIYAHVMVLFVPQFSHKYLDIILYTAIFGVYLVLRVAKALKVHEQKKASYLRCA